MQSNAKLALEEQSPRVTTARNVAWNYAGHIYQIVINLGITFYVVRHLNVPEYGLLLFITSLSSTLYLLDMGLSSILVQSYVAASLHQDKHQLTDLLSTAFVALSVLGTIGAFILIGLSFALPGPFKIPAPYLHSASLVFLLTALFIQFALPTIALDLAYQAGNRFDRLNQFKLVGSTLQLLLTIAVLCAGYRIVGLASVQAITMALQLILLFVALPSSVPNARLSLTRFRWNLLRQLGALSKWAFLNDISAYILELFGWTILGSLGSMRDAALFGLASKLPRQLWNLVDKGASVARPTLSEHFLNNDLKSLRTAYLRSQKLVIGGVLPFIALGCLFAGPLIRVWAGAEYAQAAVVMQWLLLAALSHAILYSSDLLLYSCGRVREAAWISAAGGAIGLVGSFLLVPRFGAAGMASSIAVSQLLVCCTWFTVEGCRVSRVSLYTLLRGVGNGLGLPTVVMCAGVLLTLSLHTVLSPLWLVICAIVSGILYLAIWGRRTALPLARNQVEIAK